MLILFSRLRTVVFLALLGVVGIVAYWQALNGYFLSDDFVSVLHMQRMDEDFNVLLRDFWSNWGGRAYDVVFSPFGIGDIIFGSLSLGVGRRRLSSD